MHLYIATRGIKNKVDQFITELQGKYLPYKWVNPADPKKELKTYMVQVSVRPIQLWEIVFPEEHYELMASTILGEGQGKCQHKKHEKLRFLARKALGIKAMKPYDATNYMPITRQDTEIVGIGIKTDYWVDISGANIQNPTDEQKKVCFEAL